METSITMPTREQAEFEAPGEAQTAAEGPSTRAKEKEPEPSAAQSSSELDAASPSSFLPALLGPFRQRAAIRWDYPLFLTPLGEPTSESSATDASPNDLSPLPELLANLLPEAPAARILRDNVLRLERAVRDLIADEPEADGTHAALPVLRKAAQQMRAELELGAEDAESLEADLEALLARIPEGSVFEPLSGMTPLHLLVRAARRRFVPRRQAFLSRANDLASKLRAMLEIDRGKRPEGRSADAIRGAMGALGGRFIDSAALANALGEQRGSAPLDDDRRREVEAAAHTLENAESSVAAQVLVISDHPLPDLSPKTLGDVRVSVADDPCSEAVASFKRVAGEATETVRAARLAERVIEQTYEPGRDRPLLERLDWRSFRPEELSLIPPIVACTSAPAILDRGMLSLSRLLLSGMPIQVLMRLEPGRNAAADQADEAGEFVGYRFEPAYLALAHRQAFVQQTSAARPAHMNAGFERGLELPRSALHVVAELPESAPGVLSPWLVAQAAIESRAHPLFRYDPTAGSSWARRFSLDGNPQEDLSWPVYPADWSAPVEGDQEDKQGIPFTFADFALLDPALAKHLEPLPEEIGEDAAVPLAEWLELEPEEARGAIPFVWAVDGEDGKSPRRLAISRSLAIACRDRLAFWRTLQELGGIQSEYVEQAIERAREEASAEVERRIEELQNQHAEEIEALRTSAAEELVDNLIGGLLATDAASLAATPPRSTDRTANAAVTAQPATGPAEGDTPEGAEMPATAMVLEAPPLEQEEKEEESLEAYIDTELCTTCNDCTNLNPLMFAYNADKKAYIKDIRAGTFQQLVQAAEKCPARIIHPGSPINPDEPDLEAWIQRAKKFN